MDNAQELRHRKMNLMADYYGPEDPGQNPAFMMDKDEEGNRIMIIQIDGEQADVLFDSRGPLRARTWRDRTYADIPRDIQESLMQQAYSLWLSYKDTPFGRSWIEAARSEELQRERRRNPWVYAPNGPPSLGYASEPYEMIHRPSRHLTRRVHGMKESTPRRTQPSRLAKVSGKSVLELQDERLEREAARYGEVPQLALTDELVIDKFRDRKIRDFLKREMLPWMEKNFTRSISDGVTVIPKYTKEGLGKEYKEVLVTTIRDWLKIHIFHLGTKYWVDLYNTAIKEDGWIVVDVVDTNKKKAIRDQIKVGDKVTLTGALQATDKDNADPEIIDLTETAEEINLELAKVEAVPEPEVVNQTLDNWLSDWPTEEDEVNKDTIKEKLKEAATEAIKTAKLKESYKEIIEKQLAENVIRTKKNVAQNAFEDNQEQDWIQEIVQLEEERETLVAKMQKQDRDAADRAKKLTDALKEEKRKAEVLEEEQKDWETAQKKLNKELQRAKRAVQVKESDLTGYTSKSPYHEDESDSEEVDDEDVQHLEDVKRVEPESYMNVNGRKVVLNNWESNQRTYETEPDYWETVEQTFVKGSDGYYHFPPITVTTLFQVEISRWKILEALKKQIGESKDAHSNLFETARTCLKYGIDHNLLPEIYCDLVVSPDERTHIFSMPEVRRDLTKLIDYINSKSNRVTGPDQAEARTRKYLSREMGRPEADLRLIVSRLRWEYARDIIRTMPDFHKMGMTEQRVLTEKISRDFFVAELKLNYKHVYEKAMEHGFINDKVPKMAENIQGIFSVEAKKKKSGVNSTTVAKDRKKAARSQSVPSRAPKKKEKPKKKVNTFTPQQIRRPSGNGNNPKPRKEYKRDTSTLVPIRNSPGDYLWTSKDKQCKNIKLPCRYHKPLGVSAQDCLTKKPDHCFECSVPGRRAEPVQVCTGKHQWKPKPRKGETNRRK